MRSITNARHRNRSITPLRNGVRLRGLLLAALFLVGGCATVRPIQAPMVFETPAYGQLMCAIEEASGFGFYPPEFPLELYPEDWPEEPGEGRLIRTVDYTFGDVLREVGTRVATLGLRSRNRVTSEHLLLTESDGVLRAHLIGQDENGEAAAPRASAIDDVELIVAACGS